VVGSVSILQPPARAAALTPTRQRTIGRGGSGDRRSTRNGPRRRRPRWKRYIALVALAPFLFLALFVLAFAAGSGGPPPTPSTAVGVADIPANYLALYQEAASAYGLDWAILAGVGKVECDHGRSTLEGCNPPGTVNRAGARGPMQFLRLRDRRRRGRSR
jgi:hypothetical protein